MGHHASFDFFPVLFHHTQSVMAENMTSDNEMAASSSQNDKKRKLLDSEHTSEEKPDITPKSVLRHHDRHSDEDGDLEIVASDNVLFKIHLYEMQAAS